MTFGEKSNRLVMPKSSSFHPNPLHPAKIQTVFCLSWRLSFGSGLIFEWSGGEKVNDLSECIEQMDRNNNSFWHFPSDFFDSYFCSNTFLTLLSMMMGQKPKHQKSEMCQTLAFRFPVASGQS